MNSEDPLALIPTVLLPSNRGPISLFLNNIYLFLVEKWLSSQKEDRENLHSPNGFTPQKDTAVRADLI